MSYTNYTDGFQYKVLLKIIKKQKREPVSVRINPTAHKSFSRYCDFSGMTVGEFYEQAGIEYIKQNPAKGIVFIEEVE